MSVTPDSSGALLALLDKASEEIAAYRQRQITMFREAAIVEALITWGGVTPSLLLSDPKAVPLYAFLSTF